MSVAGRIGPIARRQLGLVTTEQVLGAGVTPAQMRRDIRTGGLVPVRHRVYRINGVPITWPQAVLAAVLASGEGAVASHATAGALWDLSAVWPDAGALHISGPRQVRLAGVRSHVIVLGSTEQGTCHGIPVTSVERTLLDLAATLTAEELGACVDDALRRRLMRLERLRELTPRCPGRGRRRVLPMRLVLADRLEGYDPGGSPWERDMDRRWDSLGLPPGVRQYPVTAGGHRYILDRALPDLKIGIEWNGFAHHGTRSAFDYDSDRRADLTAAGWHMVDFTSRSNPERVVAAVQGAIQTRSGLAPPER